MQAARIGEAASTNTHTERDGERPHGPHGPAGRGQTHQSFADDTTSHHITSGHVKHRTARAEEINVGSDD